MQRLKYTLTPSPTLTEKPIKVAQESFVKTWNQTIDLGAEPDDKLSEKLPLNTTHTDNAKTAADA